MDILNISVRASRLSLWHDHTFVGLFGDLIDRFARGSECYRDWTGSRLNYPLKFEGEGLKGYIDEEGIPQIEEAPSFKEAWMVMAMAAKTSADKAELERRFRRHEREIRLLAEGWSPDLDPVIHTVIHDKWMRIMEKAWEVDKESPYRDGFCSAATVIFRLLTGRPYPVPYCY